MNKKMKQKIIIGNWKNYLGQKESISLAHSLLDLVNTDKTRVMVSPNHLYLNEVNKILSTTNIEVISQNLTSADSKSDTGGITVLNLKEININRSLIAHSETRIREKTPQSILLEILPICFPFVLCFEKIDQIPFDILNNNFEIILAYEPVWAIGTGATASIGHINEIHLDVKSKLSELGLNIPILYGGSVNPSNCKKILALDNVDGVLVGGASTKYDLFKEIVTSI
mgnify:CR=1 FL=1|tara:strand:- start:1079 stop:1759 length:681 start_codon:yes stop_codon:yes gene_type:complete